MLRSQVMEFRDQIAEMPDKRRIVGAESHRVLPPLLTGDRADEAAASVLQ